MGIQGNTMTLERMRFSRRRALGLLLATTGAGLAAACTSNAPTVAPQTAPPPAPQAAPATPAATSGGVLRVGNVGDVANIDGHSWGPNSGFSIFMIFDSLTTYDQNLKPQPELAESWDISSDARQITLNLRKGVQFHSGRELTSEDVVYNLMRPLDPQLQATIASFTILPGFVPTGTTFAAKDKYTSSSPPKNRGSPPSTTSRC